MRLYRASDRVAVPWRNGLGLTEEVLATPDWRISIAAIDADAAFSRFEGCGRTLVLLEGGPLTLAGAGWRQRLVPGDTATFAGEDAVHAAIAAPARVLNVMTVRGTFANIRACASGPIGPGTIAVARDDRSTLAGMALASHDAVTGPARIDGSGRLFSIRFGRVVSRVVSNHVVSSARRGFRPVARSEEGAMPMHRNRRATPRRGEITPPRGRAPEGR